MLSEVMDLDKFHAALGANVGPHVLVFHQVVLQLAAVSKRLVALCALVCGRALMAGQVALQVRIGWKLETTLGADMALTILVFVLVGPQLAWVCKATATEATAVGLDVRMLEHVPLQVAGLREGLFTNGALVRSGSLVGEQVSLEVARLLEELSTV